MQVAAKEPDSRWQDGEEEEEDEEWLREIEEVAALFVSLVLEDQLAPQPLGGGKSPAATKPAAGVGRVATASNAPEVRNTAWRLARATRVYCVCACSRSLAC